MESVCVGPKSDLIKQYIQYVGITWKVGSFGFPTIAAQGQSS